MDETQQDNPQEPTPQTPTEGEATDSQMADPSSDDSPVSDDDSIIVVRDADEESGAATDSADMAGATAEADAVAGDEAAGGDDIPSAGAAVADAQAPAVDPTAAVEAILFATDTPLTPAKIAQVAKAQGIRAVREIVKTLNERYQQAGCAFRIESIAGGYQMLTQPEYHEVLARLFRARSETKLSGASLETLSIVAYRQPILRADIEAIRGVASGEVLRTLMDRQLVKIVGRAEIVGRPMLYGTTRKFLEIFGLGSLEDLPRAEELRGEKDKGMLPAHLTPAPQQAPAETQKAAAAQQSAASPEAAATAPAADEGQPPPAEGQSPVADTDEPVVDGVAPEPVQNRDEPAAETGDQQPA